MDAMWHNIFISIIVLGGYSLVCFYISFVKNDGSEALDGCGV